ncbi:fibronectin type III domain-containing protein [Ichthyenterobacterium sp. W332]|uniref:Fibronectin type III domain-containing protein n=1 Tax=Microcosmobacter mediterraneus TaxID=3075607 RepID=A0ABU2YMP5_9FLAO|nr:fibronectin type III domain-containing protein [Ichthyenterobacterium sp. W332]MDT0559082.1 fibronectin type III domain-containing protein [Ichthyenterobacterium sp. W332]
MKKFNFFICLFALVLISCGDDDDAMVPQCVNPINLEESNITFDSVALSWDDLNNTNSFTVEYGLSGFEQGSGTTINSTENSLLLTGLTANTTYDYYVQTSCDVSNVSLWSEVKSFTTLASPVIPQFLTNLSDLNLFSGNLADLTPTPYAFEYELSTPLFSDYAHKHRFIALPIGTTLGYEDDGLPIFPDNTVIAKTFFYNNDERNLSLGRKIIETRLLIKIEGSWETADYKWNDAQTDAVLDFDGSVVPITWIDAEGDINNLNYEIPSNTDCFTCHQTFNEITPIGPRLRTLNFVKNGVNQLQQFIDENYITGISSSDNVSALPVWTDDSYTLEQRARAYFDIQCAHCHIKGGFCETQSPLRLDFESSFDDSKIFDQRFSIQSRISNFIPGFSMPFIGTTTIHDEGVELLQAYLDTL